MTDCKALCAELLDEIPHESPLTCMARAALAQPEPEPADSEVAELVQAVRDAALNDEWGNHHTLIRAADLLERLSPPQPVPTDEELLEVMPQQFRDDLATVSRLAAHGAGSDVGPGLFRVSLNTGALDFARAVLARWGNL